MLVLPCLRFLWQWFIIVHNKEDQDLFLPYMNRGAFDGRRVLLWSQEQDLGIEQGYVLLGEGVEVRAHAHLLFGHQIPPHEGISGAYHHLDSFLIRRGYIWLFHDVPTFIDSIPSFLHRWLSGATLKHSA